MIEKPDRKGWGYRRVIGTAASIASLVAWPIAIQLIKRELPRETLGPTVLACLVFYVCCAILLRSPPIVGALIGAIVGLLCAPAPIIDSGPFPRAQPLAISVLFGVGLGWACQAEIADRKKQASQAEPMLHEHNAPLPPGREENEICGDRSPLV